MTLTLHKSYSKSCLIALKCRTLSKKSYRSVPFPDDVRIADECTITLYPSDWNDTTHEAITTFRVLATRDYKQDGDKATVVNFSPIQTSDAENILNGYQVQSLKVI